MEKLRNAIYAILAQADVRMPAARRVYGTERQVLIDAPLLANLELAAKQIFPHISTQPSNEKYPRRVPTDPLHNGAHNDDSYMSEIDRARKELVAICGDNGFMRALEGFIDAKIRER